MAGWFAILAGSDWIAEFLPKYYWTFDPKLVRLMLSLHKPVLTFGSHALAGLFVYLFFFANWETYRARRSTSGLVFAQRAAVRFASGGTLRGEINYLLSHPLSPVGLKRSESAFEVESGEHFFIGDSGPLEYLVRGSVPLLVLVYFGLYRFLRGNLAARAHLVVLFLVIIAFETGFSALGSSRTYFLLPFFVIYLNHVAAARKGQLPSGSALWYGSQAVPV